MRKVTADLSQDWQRCGKPSQDRIMGAYAFELSPCSGLGENLFANRTIHDTVVAVSNKVQ